MEKRGQVTLFILIAILLLFVIGLYYGITQKKHQLPASPVLGETEAVEPVRQYLQLCLVSMIEDALTEMGAHGRITENKMIEFGDQRLNYFYYNTLNLLPPMNVLEDEVADYVKEHINADCLHDFREMKGVRVVPEGMVVTDAAFNYRTVHIDLYYPMTVYYGKDGNTETRLDAFNADLEVPMSQYYNTIRTLVKKKYEDPERLDVSFLFDSPYDFSFVSHDDFTLVYQLTDPNPGVRVKGRAYTWQFAFENEE